MLNFNIKNMPFSKFGDNQSNGIPKLETSIKQSSDLEWPKISVITASYNQGQFIEQTIRSVLLQNYPNLEYIIIDGGSIDDTVEIIRRYEPWISYWVSEPDRGQSHAINKGLKLATGDIWAYINSDDCYEPGTFHKIAAEFVADRTLWWATGHAEYMTETGEFVEALVPTPFSSLKETLILWEGPRSAAIQVSNFMSIKVLQHYGFFDEALHYCMDAEFGLRLLADGITPKIIPEVLAKARLHARSKTISQAATGMFTEEGLIIVQKFLPKLNPVDQLYVEQKIAQCQFFTNLGKVTQLHKSGNIRCFIQETLSMLIQHPSYLKHRATWGMFRQVLKLKI